MSSESKICIVVKDNSNLLNKQKQFEFSNNLQIMNKLPENDKLFQYVRQYYLQPSHTESELEQYALAMKKFRLISELLKITTISDIKELFRTSNLIKVESLHLFNKHCQPNEMNSIYFIVKGRAIAQKSFVAPDEQNIHDAMDMQAIPDWRIAQDTNIITQKFSLLVDYLIIRQGTRKLVDLTKFVLAEKQKNHIEASHWTRLKNIFHSSAIPQIQLQEGDFFTSALKCGIANQFQELVSKRGFQVVEVTSKGFKEFVNHIQKRMRISELIYLSKVNLFTSLKMYQIECLYKSVKTCEFKRGHFIVNEGQKCDSIFLIREGEVEMLTKNIIPQGHIQYKQQNQRFMYQMVKLLCEQSTIGDIDCYGNGISTITARVSSAQGILYQIKFSDYIKIVDEEKLQKQYINMEDSVQQYKLPNLYDSVRLGLQENKTQDDVVYQRRIEADLGVTYLIPVKKGTKILDSSHADNSQLDIHKQFTNIVLNKSIHIYQKMIDNYKQIDIVHPLIVAQQITNDRHDFLKNLSKQYTKKLSPRKQQQSMQMTHREKMRKIQNYSPDQIKIIPDLNQRRKTLHAPLKQVFLSDQQALRMKQFMPSDIYPVYCHLSRSDSRNDQLQY